MGRGQNVEKRDVPEIGWTKQELLDTGDISGKSFDLLRKAARVKGPTHGGLTWVFGIEDVMALVLKAEGGTFSERAGGAAAAWRVLLEGEGVLMEPRITKRAARQKNRQH